MKTPLPTKAPFRPAPLRIGTRFEHEGHTYTVNAHLPRPGAYRDKYECYCLTKSPLGPHRMDAEAVERAAAHYARTSKMETA